MRQLNFNAPEEVIIEDAKLKLELARERLSDLANLGINQTWLDQFQTRIHAYEALPPDADLLARQKNLTADKDETLKAAERWGNLLRDRCKFAFGSTPRNPFPLIDFRNSARNESKMLQVLPNLIAIASQHAPLLKTFGQAPDCPSQGQSLRNRLDELNCQQEKAKRERRLATDNRRQAISAVYEHLGHLNTVARIVYRDQPSQRSLFKGLPSRTANAAPTPAEPPPQA